MATPNTANIFVGAPDQTTTGAIFTAAVGSAAPTDAVTALAAAYTSSGYVSDQGVQLTPNLSTNDLRDWSGKVVRRLKTSFDGTISFELLELSEESAKQAFGDSAVTVTAANTTHGKQLAIKMTGDLPEAKAWAFNIKDGVRKARIFCPNAQVTSFPSMTFNIDDAIKLPVEITCYPDSSGVHIYIFTDDGVTTA